MPVFPSLSFRSVGGSAPVQIPLAPGQQLELSSVSATFNGASASGTFLACMSVYSQSGVLIGRWFPAQRFAVGDSGEVTYSPFSGGAGGASVVQFQLICFAPDETVVTGDGAIYFGISEDMDGMALIACESWLVTASSSGLPTVQIANVNGAVDVLSTKLSIDANETTSETAATPAVINAANATAAKGQRWRVDVDVAGTGAKGLIVGVTFG